MPLADAVRIAKDVANGLQAAHAKGMIHRDIKPSNLWLDSRTGRTIILDFGLARQVDAGNKLTKLGEIVGTPAYLSPEQARGEKVDHRTDLFSFGTVLYQMVTGQKPFQGTDTVSLLMALVESTPRDPHQLDSKLPQSISKVIMQLLEKKPDRRPADASAVVEALTKADTRSSKSPQSQQPQRQADSGQKQRYRGSHRRKMIAMITALFGLLAAIFVVVAKYHDSIRAALDAERARLELEHAKEPPNKTVPEIETSKDVQEKRYLTDLKELDVHVGAFAFGKGYHGKLPLTVNGIETPHGLFMHPPSKGAAWVKYDIAALGADQFVASVGLMDDVKRGSAFPMTFSLIADQKVIWSSKPIQFRGDIDQCRQDLNGVRVLELKVFCSGGYTGAYGVWVEPHLLLTPSITAIGRQGQPANQVGAFDILKLLSTSTHKIHNVAPDRGSAIFDGKALLILTNVGDDSSFDLPYTPPSAYVLTIQTKHLKGVDDFRLKLPFGDKGRFSVSLSPMNSSRSPNDVKVPVSQTKERTIVCKVVKGRITIDVDSAQVADVANPNSNRSPNPNTKSECVNLGCAGRSQYQITKLEVTHLPAEP